MGRCMEGGGGGDVILCGGGGGGKTPLYENCRVWMDLQSNVPSI